MADGIVPAIIWVVLFGGAFLTIGFTFFFGAENLRAQVLMTGALSVLIFAGLLTVVAIESRTGGSRRRSQGFRWSSATAIANVRYWTKADIGRRWQLRLPGNDATLYRLWPTRVHLRNNKAKLGSA
jgi:hypothetical protein